MMPATSQSSTREVSILKDADAIARRAAAEILRLAEEAVARSGRFSIALAGGSTPKLLYSLMATDASLREKFPWDKMHFFFGDERHVGPDDAQSNFKMANDSMLSKVPAKPGRIYRIKAEYPDAEQAAREYEQVLRDQFQLKPAELPRFDLVLTGMGDEGHTLSLFPGTKGLHATDRLVISNWVGKFDTHRITITASVANNAREIIFMVAGKSKAPALKSVLEGPCEPEQLPAQLLRPSNGKLLWLVDEEAGSLLSNKIAH
jgi:6-phosphogluconolactonase